MANAYSAKLNLALKALSMNRGRLATELGVDKSIVGRWARGAVRPSPENLTRLTCLIADRVPGFTILDWDRDLTGLAAALGVDPDIATTAASARTGSRFHDELIDEAIEATARRGAAIEGFFKSTRPRGSAPGQFLHDHVMVRLGSDGLLRFDLRCDHVQVTGWLLPQRGQLFMIGAESVSGSLAFGIFNGVVAERVRMDVIDGLLLSCALDASLTPTACALVFERVGELSDDPAADNARLDEMGACNPLATPETAPEALTSFLVRDIGPSQLALGGDWLLRMPLARSLARGAGLAQRAGGFARAFSNGAETF